MINRNLKALEVCGSLDRLEAKNDIWASFASFVLPYGFEYSGYMDLPGPGERLEENIICNSLPKNWLDRYLRNNYIVNDPLALHLARIALPYTLNDVWDCPDYGRTQRQILHELSEFGITAILNVPLRSPRNGPAMICLAGTNSALSEYTDLVAAALYDDLRLRPPYLQQMQPPCLTDREKECLQFVALGKSDREIGEALKISDKTANFHIESVKRKYSVSSRTLAAFMAAKAGVIHV